MLRSGFPHDWVERMQSYFGFGISQEGEFRAVEPSEMMPHTICSDFCNPLPFVERDANVTALVVGAYPSVLGVLGLSALPQIFKPVVVFRAIDVIYPFGEFSGHYEPYEPVFSAEASKESDHSIAFTVYCSDTSANYATVTAALLPIEPIVAMFEEKIRLLADKISAKVRVLHKALQGMFKENHTSICAGVQLA